MLIGMRNGMMVGGWKNPYVTDGLVAMWDGEWNAGGGVHDASTGALVDLSGNGNTMSIVQNCTIYDKSISLSRSGLARAINVVSDVRCIEIVAKQTIATDDKTYYSSCLFAPLGEAQRSIDVLQIVIRSAYVKGTGRRGFSASALGLHSYQFNYSSDTAISAAWFDGESKTIVSPGDNNFFWGRLDNNTAQIGFFSEAAFVGEIFTVRCYSRALTAAEIAANYAVDKARFNLP